MGNCEIVVLIADLLQHGAQWEAPCMLFLRGSNPGHSGCIWTAAPFGMAPRPPVWAPVLNIVPKVNVMINTCDHVRFKKKALFKKTPFHVRVKSRNGLQGM